MKSRPILSRALTATAQGGDRKVGVIWHTQGSGICLRLMEEADIYQIAKNCRTSIEMIEQFYAVHLKTRWMPQTLTSEKRQKGKKEAERSIKNSAL